MNMLSYKFGEHELYYYDSADPVIKHLKKGILYGLSNYKILDQFIIEDGVILDCGAHIGTFSFYPAMILGKKIVMIEGGKKNIECLNKTFSNINNAVIHHAILSDSIHKCNFIPDYGPFCGISRDFEGNMMSSTIDNILYSMTENISAIKFDLEGNEGETILGSSFTLNRCKPVLLLEINAHCLSFKNKTPRYIFDILDNMDYIPFLTNNDVLIPINKNKIFPFCIEDIIAIHKNNLHKYLQKYTILQELSTNEIHNLIYNNYHSSNNDCKKIFKKMWIS